MQLSWAANSLAFFYLLFVFQKFVEIESIIGPLLFSLLNGFIKTILGEYWVRGKTNACIQPTVLNQKFFSFIHILSYLPESAHENILQLQECILFYKTSLNAHSFTLQKLEHVFLKNKCLKIKPHMVSEIMKWHSTSVYNMPSLLPGPKEWLSKYYIFFIILFYFQKIELMNFFCNGGTKRYLGMRCLKKRWKDSYPWTTLWLEVRIND